MTTVFILFTSISLRHSDYHSIIILMSESYPYDSNYALNVQIKVYTYIIHCSVLSLTACLTMVCDQSRIFISAFVAIIIIIAFIIFTTCKQQCILMNAAV